MELQFQTSTNSQRVHSLKNIFKLKKQHNYKYKHYDRNVHNNTGKNTGCIFSNYINYRSNSQNQNALQLCKNRIPRES